MEEKVEQACEDLIGCEFEEYILEEILAIGTYGAVYKLLKKFNSNNTNNTTPEYFAGKLLFKQGLSQEQIEMQKDEVKFNKTVGKHNNVCYLENYVETEDHILLVFELCDGGDLFDAIKAKGIHKEDTKFVFSQVIEGVRHIHSKGVYHRDLKPENILLQSNTWKIADLGLATYEKSPARHRVGSKQYMAPELFDGIKEVPTVA